MARELTPALHSEESSCQKLNDKGEMNRALGNFDSGGFEISSQEPTDAQSLRRTSILDIKDYGHQPTETEATTAKMALCSDGSTSSHLISEPSKGPKT